MHVATDIDKAPARPLGCSIDPMSVLLVIQVSSIFFQWTDQTLYPTIRPVSLSSLTECVHLFGPSRAGYSHRVIRHMHHHGTLGQPSPPERQRH